MSVQQKHRTELLWRSSALICSLCNHPHAAHTELYPWTKGTSRRHSPSVYSAKIASLKSLLSYRNSLCSSWFIKTKSELIRRRAKGVRPHRGCILLIVQLYCFFSMDLNSEQISTEQSLDFSTGYMWDKGFRGRTWMGETRAGTEHVCFKLKACQRTALKHAGPCECLQMTSLFKNSSASYSTALAGRFLLYFKQWY